MKTSIALVFLAPAAITLGGACAIGQPLPVALVLGAVAGFVCVIVFMCQFESAPKTSRGEFLEILAHDFGIAREYYGDSKGKPNDYCYYDKSAEFPGWYESDDTLRDRISEKFYNA